MTARAVHYVQAAMDEVADWARGLDGLVERIAPRFRRVEPRRRAVAYLKGLLAPASAQEWLAAGGGRWRFHARWDAGFPGADAVGC